MDRDIRAEAGFDDRPVILVCGDSGALPTGVARVIRGIFMPLAERGEFQVLQHGWFHMTSGNIPVNYRIVPNRRHPKSDHLFDPDDRWGQETFDKLVANVRPDIVCAVADYTRVDHIIGSAHRSSFLFAHYLPLDTLPPTPRWGGVAAAADLVVYYTKLAQHWGTSINVPGSQLPHGIDCEVYQPASDEERRALRRKFFAVDDESDTIIIGTVGRNQRRKRHDLLIEAFAHLYHGGYSLCDECNRLVLHTYMLPGGYFEPPQNDFCPHCQKQANLRVGKAWSNAMLYLHTDPDEPGQDAMPVRKLQAMWRVEDPCKMNPAIDLRMGKGLSDQMMAGFYQCMDLYVHAADGGGWELPPMEAGACGVPVVAVDAPAQNEYLRTMPGTVLSQGDPIYLREMDGYRVFGRLDDLCLQILRFLESEERRKTAGKANAEWAKSYHWDQISAQWEDLFRAMLNPTKRVDRWRVLLEA